MTAGRKTAEVDGDDFQADGMAWRRTNGRDVAADLVDLVVGAGTLRTTEGQHVRDAGSVACANQVGAGTQRRTERQHVRDAG